MAKIASCQTRPKFHVFVFVFTRSMNMGTQVHVFELIACNPRFVIANHDLCIHLPHVHVLHVLQERETQSFPDFIPLNVAIEATPRPGDVEPRPRPGRRPACFPEIKNCVCIDLS